MKAAAAWKIPLEGVRVVDFSNVLTGAQASQFLADYGADVTHVEPPGGGSLRRQANWPFLGRGKRSIQLDLKDAEDRATAQALAGAADVVIETFRPGVAERLGLGYGQLGAGNPGLVHASITGFGSRGPYAGLQGYEGVVLAKLGVYWALAGLADRPGPCFSSAPYGSYPTSQLAVQGVLAALYDREITGLGQKVETSLAQGMSIHDTGNWFSRVVAQKFADAYVRKPRVQNGIPTGGLSYRLLVAMTKDGRWLQFSQTTQRLFVAMMNMFGLAWMFEDPKWKSLPDFEGEDQRREYWEILLNVVRSKTHAEWMAEFDRDPNVWAEEFRRHGEALDHPQMIYNRMVSERVDPAVGPLREPGALVRLDRAPAPLDRPAPALGQYDAVIRAEAKAARPAPAARRADRGAKPPLDGVTVVELATYYAAPYASTLLAELGARVIKLEQPDGDPHRNMLPFPESAGLKALQGKDCVAVDLNTSKGRVIAHRILAKTDIVLQGFRAGVARRQGFDAESLQARYPNLIYLSAPGYGEGGPYGHRPAFAPTIGAAAGLAFRNVGGSLPADADLSLDQVKAAALRLAAGVSGVGNADAISAVSAASALMLGLVARQRGAGAHRMLTSMVSSTTHCLSEVTVDYEGKPPVPTADAMCHGFSSLYRLYQAEGEDWVFLAAPKEREWARLACALPGGEALAADARFATPSAREANDEALAQALQAIFRTRAAQAWEHDLRAADVACVMAAPAPVEANYMDPGSVGAVQDLVTTGQHPILEEVQRLKALVRFSRSGTVTGDAGLVGQDTQRVLREFGYGDADIAALAEEGVIVLG